MNAIHLYPVLFGMVLVIYYYYFFRRATTTNVLGIGMLVWLFVFAVFANIFYSQPVFYETIHYWKGKTFVSASIYLFLLYMIWILPFLKGKFAEFSSVRYSPALDRFIYFLLISAFIEALLLFPAASGGVSRIAEDMAGLREDASDSGNIGGGITSLFVLFYSFFSTILPVALFYYLAFTKRKKLVVLLSISTMLTPILNTMATGSREHFVFPLLDLLVAYLIFYPFLNKNTKLYINIALGSVGGFVFLLSVWMSVSRFSDSIFDPSYYIYKYLGEGFVNFNTILFNDSGEPCYGDFGFAYFRELLGLRYSENNDVRRMYWDIRQKYPTNLFYSLIGALVIDFGKVGAIVFSIIIVRLTYVFTKIKNHIAYFSQLIMLHFVAGICVKGVFYFYYCSIFGGRTMLVMVILCLILRYGIKT